MRTRVYKKNFWFNEEEKEALAHKSSLSGMTESDYIRNLVLGYEPKEKPDERFYKVMRMFRNTANNINQIAKELNCFGVIDVPYFRKQVDKINELMEEIKRKFLIMDRGDNK